LNESLDGHVDVFNFYVYPKSKMATITGCCVMAIWL